MGTNWTKEAPLDDDDESVTSAESQKDDLSSQIMEKLETATTFQGKKEQFLPEGVLDELATTAAIRDVLKLNDPQKHVDLVNWIESDAKRVLAVTLQTVNTAKLRRWSMIAFWKSEFTDASLPVDNPGQPAVLKDIPHKVRKKWSKTMRNTFWEKQWMFIVKVFSAPPYHYDLSSQVIFPILYEEGKNRSKGNLSTVYCVEMHPKHIKHPSTRVRQLSYPPFRSSAVLNILPQITSTHYNTCSLL